MWGRDSRHEDLVPVVNGLSVSSKEDLDMEGDILDQYDPILDEFHSENITVPAYLDQPEVLDIAPLDQFREKTYKLAKESISTGQLAQKRQYDKKVSLNR